MTRKIFLNIAYIALFSALIFILTYFIKIPYPLNNGYFNLSDALIIFSSIYFGPIVSIPSAIISTSLADLFSGYASSIIFTIIAKSLESILAFIIFKLLYKRKTLKYILLYISIIPMVLTYFIYYLIINNFNVLPSLTSSMFDVIQGVIGVSISIILYLIFNKINITNRYIY